MLTNIYFIAKEWLKDNLFTSIVVFIIEVVILHYFIGDISSSIKIVLMNSTIILIYFELYRIIRLGYKKYILFIMFPAKIRLEYIKSSLDYIKKTKQLNEIDWEKLESTKYFNDIITSVESDGKLNEYLLISSAINNVELIEEYYYSK